VPGAGHRRERDVRDRRHVARTPCDKTLELVPTLDASRRQNFMEIRACMRPVYSIEGTEDDEMIISVLQLTTELEPVNLFQDLSVSVLALKMKKPVEAGTRLGTRLSRTPFRPDAVHPSFQLFDR
jgi:hypothetical protein